ncbi:hypothetical protein GO013_00090 [Pseudodesulfovibrio sp. JC047]|uniref:DUF6471 domain-containing protein n=1 Tax=Pseudodesulfovibrio sp. JC047 TaxID=2683199 RepID=UPI0013D02C69|nr:DUF6471 domain-containing protein [Pseudodesulfovibrio sp. JC047]NDV17817.1 hypothetical protein [Pseudodesulfovibrio sp. JC047]
MDEKWNDEAKKILKSLLARNGKTQKELAELLCQHGCKETRSSVTTKINRGKFTFAWFLLVLSILDLQPEFKKSDTP